jgi:hypothetical protein
MTEKFIWGWVVAQRLMCKFQIEKFKFEIDIRRDPSTSVGMTA